MAELQEWGDQVRKRDVDVTLPENNFQLEIMKRVAWSLLDKKLKQGYLIEKMRLSEPEYIHDWNNIGEPIHYSAITIRATLSKCLQPA
ncbi:MAG: hypothetical protein ACYC36_03655 [Bellilinea sp.]